MGTYLLQGPRDWDSLSPRQKQSQRSTTWQQHQLYRKETFVKASRWSQPTIITFHFLERQWWSLWDCKLATADSMAICSKKTEAGTLPHLLLWSWRPNIRRCPADLSPSQGIERNRVANADSSAHKTPWRYEGTPGDTYRGHQSSSIWLIW